MNYFFTLSGFGLTFKHVKTRKKALEKLSIKDSILFGYKRAKKLYWLYIVTSLIPLTFCIYSTVNSDGSIVKLVLKIIINILLLQSLSGNIALSINNVAWFLSCIVIIYMAYPFLELLNDRYLIKHPWFSLLTELLAEIFVSQLFIRVDAFIGGSSQLWYSSPYSRVFDFMIGISLCDIVTNESGHTINNRNVYALLEIACIIIVIFWWWERSFICASEIFKLFIDRGIVIFTMLVFSHQIGPVSKLLKNELFVHLGNLSMFIFLIHYPAVNDLYRIFTHTGFIKARTASIISAIFVTIIGTLVAERIQIIVNCKRENERIESDI